MSIDSISQQPPETGKPESIRFGRFGESFILLILAHGRSYGYEIRSRLREDFGYQRAAADPGALYRLLREMEANGYIRSQWDTSESGPARRYYELTAAGKDQLRLGAERLRRQARRIEQFFESYGGLDLSAEPAPTSRLAASPTARARAGR